ncbi:hypothetical protein [Paenibacillus pabuli]|uniref:hypothetical protein n=1 Tax=Paenibacillus pabuli TaxID=1472 RepID=UPI003CF4CE8B
MIEKTLFKVKSSLLNTLYVDSDQEEVLKQEVYSIQNNMVTVRRIIESGVDFHEIPFEAQDVEQIILSNVEVQFALYQFYMIYHCELRDSSSQPKYVGELHYSESEGQLNEKIIFKLLSVFDSLRVAYKKGKVHVQITLSNPDSMKKIYNIYQMLYNEARLNPFISFFISKGQGKPLTHTPYVTFQYKPNVSEISEMEVNQEEMRFIEYIQQQLTLSPYLVCYCVGWREDEVMASTEIKKLAKYFSNVFFLSTANIFLSQMLIISK